MAHDEFLLEGLREKVFCLWQNRPSVIIGRSQSAYAEVDLPFLEARQICLVRRVTGGGAVYHDLGNLNYSIAGPAAEMEEEYGRMACTLQQLGIPAQRSGRNDILVDGRKCSGYAKRMSKDRILIHGTLMWDVDLENLTRALAVPGSKLQAAGIASVRSRVANLKAYLPRFRDIAAFRQTIQALWAGDSTEIVLTSQQRQAIERLACDKFRSWEWNFGHSPSASFEKSRKFACGTVTAHYTLKHGVFESLCFTGDFLGELPAEQLAQSLVGQRLEAIGSHPVERYFDRLSAGELLTLFSG